MEWRDVGDAHEIADMLEEIEKYLIPRGKYDEATLLHFAAEALREFAEVDE